MEELSVANNMDEEVKQGLDPAPASQRLGAISQAASMPQSPEVETAKAKKGISEVVKELENENKEVFQDKEEVAETVAVSKENGEAGTTPNLEREGEGTKILGMHPLVFGLVALGVGIGGYYAYKHFKGKKKTTV